MIDGRFTERELGKSFSYQSTNNAWALANHLPYQINFPNTGEIRFANVLKTVVYLAVNEAEDGRPVLEKWHIKREWHNAVD